MENENRERILKNYTTPGYSYAFSGRKQVADALNISQEDVNRNILSHNYSYPLHRDFKRPKYYNPYFIFSPRQQIQCDLIDVQRLKNENNDVHYILVCIDTFTRYAWVRGMRDKTAVNCEKALSDILEKMNPLFPKTVVFDKGTEFLNKKVLLLLKKYKIKVINPTSPSKAAYAERFNRTLQSLIYKYMTEKQTNRYIDVLQNLVETYNLRPHRSIDYFSPREAEKIENMSEIRNILMKNRRKVIEKGRNMKPKFKIGDIVRIKKEKRVFDRGYQETFSREFFKVSKINHKRPIPTYSVKSMNNNEDIKGDFYANELQLIKGDVWKIEKIIKERKRRGKKEFFVKWLDFDENHNSWVSERDMENV